MKICITGAPVSSGNRGVLALGASLVGLCAKTFNTRNITILASNRNHDPVDIFVQGKKCSIPVVNYRFSPKSAPFEHIFVILFLSLIFRVTPLSFVRNWIKRKCAWIRAIDDCDFVGDVRGGDSFSDIYGFRRYMEGTSSRWSILLVKRAVVLFPQTYGPFKRTYSRLIAQNIVNHAIVAIARDTESQAIAKSLCKTGAPILLSPDVAFTLESIVPDSIELSPSLQKLPSPEGRTRIGINVNGLMYNGGYTRDNMFGLSIDYTALLSQICESLLQDPNSEIWLIPHTYAAKGDVESDNDACFKLQAEFPNVEKNRLRVISAEYDQHELKGIISTCDFFIGSRMHSCIAALSRGVPCVGIAYSMKFKGVFESIKMGNSVIDGKTATNEEALHSTLSLYNQRNEIKETLANEAEGAKQRVEQAFEKLKTTISKPS